MFHRTLAVSLFQSHFTGVLCRQWGTLETPQSVSQTTDPAIRQIIWRLADWGQPPHEVMTLLTLEGGLGWKCVSAAPCRVGQASLLSSEVWLRPEHTLRGASCLSRSLKSTWGLVCPRASSLCLTEPTQTDVRPLGSLVGSCKPPVCSGLYSYGGPTVVAVQVPYTCKWRQADTL